MMTIHKFIQRHPALSYFVLTFVISWGGVLLIIGGPSAIPSPNEEAMSRLPLALLAMFIGPAFAGLLITGIVYGKAGLRENLLQHLRWRVGIRWYMVALLTAPLLISALLLTLATASPDFLPNIFTVDNKFSLLLTGLVAGLVVGIFEELGWTGVATPELRRTYGILPTGLIIGYVWAVWHFLVYLWGSGDSSGAFSLSLFLPEFLFLVSVLPAYRVLMVWVYDRTESLLVAMLMHASLSASTAFVLVPVVTGISRIPYYLALAIVLWAVVAAIAVANGGHLMRQTFAKRAHLHTH